MVAVYQRCLANYQSRQWDMGAHVMFNETLKRTLQAKPPTIPCFPVYGYACLSDCLLDAASQGASNAACLDKWLQKQNIASLDYFEYTEIKGSAPASQEIHACQVFSGPAKLPSGAGVPFRICLDEYEDTGVCHLPHIVWSGRSINKVPVGVDHSTVIVDTAQKVQAARNAYASIKNDVKAALDDMESWDGSSLQVSVFSAEGDLLHQYFDCLMLGALDDVDIWPGPDVAKPVWSRSRTGAATREFELPCAGDALKNRKGVRDSRSPFTCGSDARRAAIKYFLRNGVNSNNGENQNIVRAAVQQLVDRLKAAWITDIDAYMCRCADGTHGAECCKLDPSCDPSTTKCSCGDNLPDSYACCEIECRDSTFLPPRFQVAFTKIPGSDMLSGLFESVWKYVNSTVWTNNDPWLLYDDGGAAAYNWTNLQTPVDHSLFDTTAAISAYEASELGYPFKTNVWSMCHGLLQQVHFTMPMRNGKPTTISEPYDPEGVSTTLNMTYREDFVRRLVSDAYKHSPVFWHYHARHKPSPSAMCKRTQPRWPSSVNSTFYAHGYSSMTLGGYEVDCYCGWWFNSTHCKVPSVVCERLVLIIGSAEVQSVCASGGFTQNEFLLRVMPTLIKLEGGWKSWPCPAMQVSDHWGILPDHTAWIKGSRSMSGVDERILVNGTSGLRKGSLSWLLGAQTDYINPAARVESVSPLECDLSPPQSLVDNFVDDLFPAAQGVRQSAAVSACLRFTIEVARMSAYQEANLLVAVADQSVVVATWRKRCEMKLRQVAFCQVYGVYNVYSSTASCPFRILNEFSSEVSYSVTPGCLVVFRDKVYDPCLCNTLWCTPQVTQALNVFGLTSQCEVFHVRDMVVDRETSRVPWPPTSDTPIPRPLARSAFMADVVAMPSNIINNKQHWATAEGADASHYCDLVVDWWPDSWKHPVGYHVTLPCKDAAHRTFDASWAALREGSQVTMMHVQNALRNRTMQTNQFGAAGACRTHNYGMPTKIMNTMRFCTQVDNRPVDPTVPNPPSGTPNWGVEYCTTSPFQTPWANGPSSVGTYFNYLVDLLPFTSWDDKSGHAPFRACTLDAHCCVGCKCLVSKGGGICAKLQDGKFQCAQHQHCTGKLCAGDGLCVQGVLEVFNNASFDISARVLAEQCASGANKDDMWGMSKEDTVPDILNASGLCSYRSWFEHRRLKTCDATQCTIMGSDAWRFSSPEMQPTEAFGAGVLAVKPHACDRDYEHMANMYSCSPVSAQALLRNRFGESVTYRRGVRTQTYRTDKTLPIVRHANRDNLGAGFLGIDKTYRQLQFNTMLVKDNIPNLQSCSAFGLCSDQAGASMWYVNGVNEPIRQVTTAAGVIRNYDATDMRLCGSMGFVESTYCRIDPAVVPLFYEYCSQGITVPPCTTYIGGKYNQESNLVTIANNLNGLFSSRKLSVGRWSEYLTATNSVQAIWDRISAQSWTTVDGFTWAKVLHTYSSGKPRGLYFLMTYSAYELPFAWWWRCGWLSGLAVSDTNTPCEAWDQKSETRSNPSDYDVYPEAIPGKVQGSKGRMGSITGIQWLARAGGIFTTATVSSAQKAAHQAFLGIIAKWNIPEIMFSCYSKATMRKDLKTDSYLRNFYTLAKSGDLWTQKIAGACDGFADCLNHLNRVTTNKFLVQDVISMLTRTKKCSENPTCECISSFSPAVCSFAKTAFTDSNVFAQQIPSDRNYLPLFVMAGGSEISASKYDALASGCDMVHCCDGFDGCVGTARSVQSSTCKCISETPLASELSIAGITPRSDTPAWLIFADSNTRPSSISSATYFASDASWFAVDVCKPSDRGMRCTLADSVSDDNCNRLDSEKARIIQSTYCSQPSQFPRDEATQHCVHHRTTTGLDCMYGKSIAGKYVFAPEKATVQIFNVPPKGCWTLSCGPALRQFDQKVVLEKDLYTVAMTVVLDVRQVHFEYEVHHMVDELFPVFGFWVPTGKKRDLGKTQYTTRYNVVNVLIGKNTSSLEKVMSFVTRDCSYDPTKTTLPACSQNSKNSRSLSTEYSIPPSTAARPPSSYSGLTIADIQGYVTGIIQSLEDEMSTNKDPTFQARTQGCSDKVPPNFESCAVPIDNPDTKLKYVQQCSDPEILTEIRRRAITLCHAETSDEEESYEECYNRVGPKGYQFLDEAVWIDGVGYSNVIRSYYDFGESIFNSAKQIPDKYECQNIRYVRTVPSVCTASSNSCPYSNTYEQDLTSAGLPPTGFCPDCLNDECYNKASYTYGLVKNAFNLHTFLKSTPLSSTPLRADASHFSVTLNKVGSQQVQCGKPECTIGTIAAEIYRNMFSCIPCFLVPETFCTGNHMCSFQQWMWEEGKTLSGYEQHASVFSSDNTTYDQAFAAVTWAAQALLDKSFSSPVGVLPKWADFLEPYNFSGYSPTTLKETFNDNIESLKGYCKDTRKLPAFPECQNDGPRRTLRSFVESKYKVPEGSTIPSQHTLSWLVDQSQLLGTNIPAWHAISNSTFFTTLFDDSVCKRGTIANLLCYVNASVTLALNPVLSGRFEVAEGCDTMVMAGARVIDSLCNAQECPNTKDLADEYNTFEGLPAISDWNTQMRCKSRNRNTAQYMSVPDDVAVNLCTKKPPQPTACSMKQGMAGHTTWDGSPVGSVYSRGAWPELFSPSGLLSGQNPLLRFELMSARAFGNITLDPWDIGGHYIRMTLRPAGVLAVTALPLRSYATLSAATELNSTDWAGAWRLSAKSEAATMMDQFALRTCMSWDCPLRRRAFWTAQHPTFRPFSPNPFRSNQLYGSVTHPTTKPAPIPNGVLLQYKTRNGFCACPVGDSCQPASGDCSADDTIASLWDQIPRSARTLQTACAQQVDWPWVGGTMRDGSVLPNSGSGCGVLDRLPDFLYRYYNSRTVLDSGGTTLDDGGDCHMGRPASYSASSENCTLVSKTDTAMILDCRGQKVTLQRPKSPNVAVSTRTRCESCDPLPVFKTADGAKTLDEPEVSYGKLWRWAPARKLAQDLRFRLCGNATTCPAMKPLTLDAFWTQMMAGGLTGEATDTTVNALFQSVKADDPDIARWSTPWMLCTNNGSGVDCQGSATKREWLGNRKSTCDRMTSLANSNQAVADLTVCNLDDRLDNLCRVIQNARYRLFEANCQLSGSCRTSAFFYQPATYSISNDQFVRQTVQYFYNFTVHGSCPAFDEELQAIIAQNADTAQQCSAQRLEVLQVALQVARQVIHNIVRIAYYFVQIGIEAVGLVSTTDPAPIIKNIMTYLGLILSAFGQFFKIMGDLMFKIIMETGQLGRFIRDMVIKICEFLRVVYDKALKPIICIIKEIIMGILYFVERVISAISFFVGGALNGAVKDVEATREVIDNTFDCNMQNPFNCSKVFSDDDRGPTHLPMPTRCWMGYKPSIGDQRGLGCSASDTCMDDDGTLRACAACTGGVDMQRYGCDSLTKLCRCHTFPVGTTECNSHMECQLPDTECGFVDAYLQPSFGNIPCARCSHQSVCLKTGSVGQCTCLLRDTPTQMCSAQYKSQRVSPDPTQLCLVSLGGSLSSSGESAAKWLDLASSPCASLNGAQSYCLTVYLQNGGYSFMVVGLKLLSGRRLLSDAVYQPNLTEWEGAHEPCRSLMQAEHLTILEQHYATECERWRLVGERAISLYNLSARPVQFTSYLGMAEANITPSAYLYLFKHADWAQPIFVMGRRYWHLVKPILNATRILLTRVQSIPEAQLAVHQVQDLFPWSSSQAGEWRDSNVTANASAKGNFTASRRLMGWKDELQAVQEYSVQIANGNIANLAPDLAGEWSKGPFLWPPNYNYWEREHPCLMGSLMWNFTYLTMQSTVSYYTKTGPPRPPVARTFKEALPSFEGVVETAARLEPTLVTFFKDMLKRVLGFDVSSIKRYISSPDGGQTPSQLSQDFTDLIRCDFEKVQHCTGHRRSLLWGGVIVAMFLAVMSVILRTIGVPMADVFLSLAFVPLTLLFVFNYSIMCVPLVPTCMLAEVLDLLETVLPTSISWPTQLQRWPGCVNGSLALTSSGGVDFALMADVQPATAKCFRDCTEWPFNYQTWEDNVQWIACELGYCGAQFITETYQPWVELLPLPSYIYELVHLDRYVSAANSKPMYMQWDDMKQSQRICCAFTVFNVIPPLLVSVVLVVAVFAVASITAALVHSLVNTAVALLTYIHTR